MDLQSFEESFESAQQSNDSGFQLVLSSYMSMKALAGPNRMRNMCQESLDAGQPEFWLGNVGLTFLGVLEDTSMTIGIRRGIAVCNLCVSINLLRKEREEPMK